jgi:hypothetical protein
LDYLLDAIYWDIIRNSTSIYGKRSQVQKFRVQRFWAPKSALFSNSFWSLEFIISEFKQYSRRVGIAHQIQLIETVNGGQCPPYAKKFMQRWGRVHVNPEPLSLIKNKPVFEKIL